MFDQSSTSTTRFCNRNFLNILQHNVNMTCLRQKYFVNALMIMGHGLCKSFFKCDADFYFSSGGEDLSLILEDGDDDDLMTAVDQMEAGQKS